MMLSQKYLEKEHKFFPHVFGHLKSLLKKPHSQEELSSDRVKQKLEKEYGRKIKDIGKGSSGVCFVVKRKKDEKVFAVKEFKQKKHGESHEAYMGRLANEFRIASLMHHPNVIETFDFIVENMHVYQIMELCDMGDLYQEIRDKDMSQEERDCVFAQLVHGVQYLHQNEISHRDLKPENCVFDSHNHLKIIDFGSACIFHDGLHMCQEKIGTGPYVAPEVLSDQEYDGLKVDVWACAIIYLVMTFRHFPWQLASPQDKWFSHYLNSPGHHLRMLEDLGEQKTTIRAMLEPNPGDRCVISEVARGDWLSGIKECIFFPESISHRHGTKLSRSHVVHE